MVLKPYLTLNNNCWNQKKNCFKHRPTHYEKPFIQLQTASKHFFEVGLIFLYFEIKIYVYIYGIHHWRMIWSSYRKLAWVGFEPTTTEFRSDALTDWAIRPWVQLALRVQLTKVVVCFCDYKYYSWIFI